MKEQELIKAVQNGTILYGVSKKNYRIHRCKVTRLEFKEGHYMDSAIQLVGKRQPKHVGELVIFPTRKEAKEYATEQMFKAIVERAEMKVIDSKQYVIEDKEGRQWRAIASTSEFMCIAADGIRCLTIHGLNLPFCPADWTTAWCPGDEITYKWNAKKN